MKYVGVVARNSSKFVEAVFTAYSKGQVVVVMKEPKDAERISSVTLEQVIEPEIEVGWKSLKFTPNDSLLPAQIAFTSGTEGEPKGIVISHKNLADMVERLNSVMHMDHTISEYIGVPVYHSFGFGRCRAISTVGGRYYIPPNGFDPLEIKDLLLAGEINAISAVPSLWRIVFQNQEIFGDETLAVKWIEIGSQYMSAEEKLNLKSLFPNAIIVQHYGLTEASRATFLEIHSNSDSHILESVGRPVGDTQVQIDDEGCIKIKGSLVAREKWQSNTISSSLDEEGWLHTTDLGNVEDGYIYYGGRADDIINSGGVKLIPDQLEREIKARIGIKSGIACARVPDPMRGDGIIVAIEPEYHSLSKEIKAAAVEVLKSSNVQAGKSLHIYETRLLPVTPTGKVKRKILTQEYLDRPVVSENVEASIAGASKREEEILKIWQQVLNVQDISLDDSFIDVGGDSLTAIAAIIKMKKLGIDDSVCRGILQEKTVREIANDNLESDDKHSSSEKRQRSGQIESTSIKVVRGFLVLAVILAHWSEGIFNRLPEYLGGIKSAMAPLLASGTPGFAIMYGVMLGYSFIPMYQKAPDRLGQLIKPIGIVLSTGIIVLAAFEIAIKLMTHEPLTLTSVLNSFYSVLLYYLLATLSLPLWFKMLSIVRFPVISLLMLAAVLHLIYVLFLHPLTGLAAQGFIEFIKIILAAKYSYVNMTAGVFLGAAIGLTVVRNRNGFSNIATPMVVFLGVAFSILLSFAMGERDQWMVWPTQTVPAWRWVFYCVVCVVLLGLVEHQITVRRPRLKWFNWILEVLACVGLLAFPMFVLHELVQPGKQILELVGVGEKLAMILVVLAFLALSIFMIKKVHRLQFD